MTFPTKSISLIHMNRKQVPIIVYNPPKCIRALSWTVSYAPLGVIQKHESFHLKADAMKFARSVYRSPMQISAIGTNIPWDVVVSYSVHPVKN